MTMVKGGVAYNVIPSEMDVSFDLRIPPTVNLQVPHLELQLFVSACFSPPPVLNLNDCHPLQEFEGQIKAWCREAGEDITYEFAQVSPPSRTRVPVLRDVALKRPPTYSRNT